MVVSAAGCTGTTAHGIVKIGTAIGKDYGTKIGSLPIRPGVAMGWDYIFLRNTSKATLTLTSVGISGPGIGTVARVVQVTVAPLRSGYHHYFPATATPGGTYETQPPVIGGNIGHNKIVCWKQTLVPVPGYRMTPGSDARIYIVLQAVRPGKYILPSEVIYYTQRGVRYQQVFPIRFEGSVADQAPSLSVDPSQLHCLRRTGARLLSGWHLSLCRTKRDCGPYRSRGSTRPLPDSAPATPAL
jgi:hypothetical protein